MQTHKISARTMADALAQVEQQYGVDAVIVDVRACVDDPDGAAGDGQVDVWVRVPDPDPLPAMDAESPDDRAALGGAATHIAGLQEQLTLVHAKLEALGHDLQWLGAGALGTGSGLSRVLCEQIAGEVSTSGGIRLVHAPTVVALVGPTGVGKTTTVAKLAARYRREGVSVGILALDTLRPAGVQQLDAYARILDVPVVPAYTPAQAREGLDRLRDHALVLVDTPGGSPRDVDFLDELRALLGALDPHEVHLVISAVTAQAAARAVVRQFAAVQPDQVILSKVDESPALLSLLPLLTTHGLAVSYLTTSPIAPHGLLDATVATLARFLLDDEEG